MNQIVIFVKEAWLELKQVSWLSVPQMIASTWLVVILSVVMALYILGIDKLLQLLFSLLV